MSEIMFMLVLVGIGFIIGYVVSDNNKAEKEIINKQNNDSNKTIVALRETTGAYNEKWESDVIYDTWGTPCVKDKYNSRTRGYTINLKPDGFTSEYINTVQWKHLSGPEVDFLKKIPLEDRKNMPW